MTRTVDSSLLDHNDDDDDARRFRLGSFVKRGALDSALSATASSGSTDHLQEDDKQALVHNCSVGYNCDVDFVKKVYTNL